MEPKSQTEILKKLNQLLERLQPLSGAQIGVLISAQSWNMVVEAVVELTQFALLLDPKAPPPSHEHLKQIGPGWLNAKLLEIIQAPPVDYQETKNKVQDNYRKIAAMDSHYRNQAQKFKELQSNHLQLEQKSVPRADWVPMTRRIENLESLRSDIRSLKEALQKSREDWNQELIPLKQSLSDSTSKLESLEAAQETTKTEIKNLQETVQDAQADWNQQLNPLKESLSKLNSELQRLSSTPSDIQALKDSIDSSNKDWNQQLEPIRNSVTDLSNGLNELASTPSEIHALSDAIQAAQNKWEQQLSPIHASVSNLSQHVDTRFQELLDKLKPLHQTDGSLLNAVTLESKIKEIDSDVEQMESTAVRIVAEALHETTSSILTKLRKELTEGDQNTGESLRSELFDEIRQVSEKAEQNHKLNRINQEDVASVHKLLGTIRSELETRIKQWVQEDRNDLKEIFSKLNHVNQSIEQLKTSQSKFEELKAVNSRIEAGLEAAMTRIKELEASLKTKKSGSNPTQKNKKVSASRPDPSKTKEKTSTITPPKKKPVVKKPAVKEPAVKEPVVKKPAVKEPAVKEPAVKEPAVKKPAVKKPAVKKVATKKQIESNPS